MIERQTDREMGETDRQTEKWERQTGGPGVWLVYSVVKVVII